MKKFLLVFLVFVMLTSLISACGSNAPATTATTSTPADSQAPAASTPAEETVKDDKPYAGTEVVFSCLDTANFRFIEKHLPELEAKTGIKGSIEYIPESAYMTKLQVVLSSGTGEFDGMYANNKMYPALFSSGWIYELDNYINDPKLTDPSWDYKDFITKLGSSLTYEGKILGVPFGVESGMLYYNKKMFADAGITAPPKTMDDVLAYAKLLNKPDKGQAGFATVGTREGNVNGYTWIMIWKTLGGAWRPEGKEPYTVLADEPAIHATTIWTELLSKYGPQGIANYGWNELFLSLQQEKVAMAMATTKDYPVLTDPTKTKIGDSLGFACIEGPGDEYTVSNISAWMISKTSKHPEAAWQMLQFLTSKEFQLDQVEKGESVQQTRTSVLDSDTFAKKLNPEWSAAAKQAYSHGIVEYTPLIPQSNQIRECLSIGLSKALSGQATPEAAMKEANENVKKILDQAAQAAK